LCPAHSMRSQVFMWNGPSSSLCRQDQSKGEGGCHQPTAVAHGLLGTWGSPSHGARLIWGEILGSRDSLPPIHQNEGVSHSLSPTSRIRPSFGQFYTAWPVITAKPGARRCSIGTAAERKSRKSATFWGSWCESIRLRFISAPGFAGITLATHKHLKSPNNIFPGAPKTAVVKTGESGESFMLR
jgi:hypothetical protein